MANSGVNISDRKVIHTGSGPVDPNFRHPDLQIEGFNEGGAPIGGEEIDMIDPGDGEGGTGGDIGVPRDIRVESQKVRTAPNGQESVEVVLSYIPASGAATHEMRISKL